VTAAPSPIPAAQPPATINAPIVGDTAFENNESFFVTLGTPPVGVTVDRGQGTGIIVDNDFVLPVNVSVGDTTVREGDTGAVTTGQLQVTLSAPQTTAVIVRYKTVNGSAVGGTDFTAVPDGAVVIPAGQTSAFIPLQILDDNQLQGNESFTVQLTTLSGGLHFGRTVGTVTIVDNESTPVITVGDASVQEGDSGTVILN